MYDIFLRRSVMLTSGEGGLQHLKSNFRVVSVSMLFYIVNNFARFQNLNYKNLFEIFNISELQQG